MAKTPENIVQGNIILFLRKLGFSVVPTNSAGKTAPGMKGFPDLICWDYRFTFFIEVKAPGGKLRPSQVEWAKKHEAALTSNNYFVADTFESFRQWLIHNLKYEEPNALLYDYEPTYGEEV